MKLHCHDHIDQIRNESENIQWLKKVFARTLIFQWNVFSCRILHSICIIIFVLSILNDTKFNILEPN